MHPARYRPPCEALPVCLVMPPYMAEHLRQHVKDAPTLEALQALSRSAHQIRTMRMAMLTSPQRAPAAGPTPTLKRRVFDCGHSTDLLRKQVRKEGSKASKDMAVNEAYDHSGKAFEFFNQLFGRASLDNNNLPLTSSVHYQELPDRGYDNAFWNGSQMVYGDGMMFNRMTLCLDVVAHELAHGITQHEAGLRYEGQSGALNEHFSDVFGVLVRQWAKGEKKPRSADWSVGKGLFNKLGMEDMALRSMSAPGTAYSDMMFGADPQPDHMNGYLNMPLNAEGDWGGVHYNSGIPNKAFHLAAVAIGKPAWEVAGKIWYITLTERLRDNADFKKCASETISVAGDYFGATVQARVRKAWTAVGVISPGEGPVA